MKYESPITYHSKDMANVKVFEKWVKLQGQHHKVKSYNTNKKVLSWGRHIWNMKAISLAIQTIWPMLTLFKSGSNFKGQGHKIKSYNTNKKVLSWGRHILNMKALSLAIQKIWPMLTFLKSGSNFKVKVTRSKILVQIERSCHNKHTYDTWKPYHFSFKRYDQC
jgi:lauroyl/myristoyl acyltransferase